MSRLRLAAGFVLVLAGPGSAAEFRQLRRAEIAARFAGMDFTDETHWSFTFHRDGRLTSFGLGRPGTGRWWIEADRL